MPFTATKQRTTTVVHHDLMHEILDELRLLRAEVSLVLPAENVVDFANPKKIKSALHKALKQYPPLAV